MRLDPLGVISNVSPSTGVRSITSTLTTVGTITALYTASKTVNDFSINKDI